METKKGYSAKLRFSIIAPAKLRRIAVHLRKKPYSEALAILDSLPQRGARILKKLIRSAAANAMYQNKKLDEEMLYIRELLVDDGPRMKKIWARARGRADIQLKRSSHVRVVLDELSNLRK